MRKREFNHKMHVVFEGGELRGKKVTMNSISDDENRQWRRERMEENEEDSRE